MYVLEINDIKKGFKDGEVLKGVSLNVGEGEVLSVIGPSGSGKSTLLRCATMLEDIDEGEIKYAGETFASVQHRQKNYINSKQLKKANSIFGLVFQNYNLFPHMNVLENIMDAPVRVQKKKKNEAREEALSLLEKMGLSGRENSYPYMLSGGQCQRVAIARALALKPKLLFFDEPTSALDPELTMEVLKVIKSLAKLDIAMVIVTHEMEFARNVSNRIIFMDEGVIVEEGSPEQVFNSRNTRMKNFLGRYIL